MATTTKLATASTMLIMNCNTCSTSTTSIDDALLTDTPVLMHLADAMDDPTDVSLFDLIDNTDITFSSAPDPTPLFEERFEAHQALPPLGDAEELSVLTYNIGLLDRTYLLIEHVGVPEIETRRAHMGERLFTSDYDVLLLQEVWEDSDVELLAEAGAEYGYTVWGGDDVHDEHGLAIAVRSELISGTEEREEQQFDEQRDLEYFPGPGVKRGWLRWSFVLAGTTTRVHFYNLHATSYPEYYQLRDMQARQVGASVRSHGVGDVVVVGGDFNAGPYYAQDQWIDGDGDAVHDWWRNTVAYAAWLHYGGLYDVMNAVGIPADVTLGNQFPQGFQGSLTEPYGDASWCDTTRDVVFTGSDCNSLYMQQYAGTEAAARLDHIMIRDRLSKVRVDDVRLDFLDADVDGVELSDHYAVGTDIRIAR
jgi:hypothetical protein